MEVPVMEDIARDLRSKDGGNKVSVENETKMSREKQW